MSTKRHLANMSFNIYQEIAINMNSLRWVMAYFVHGGVHV